MRTNVTLRAIALGCVAMLSIAATAVAGEQPASRDLAMRVGQAISVADTPLPPGTQIDRVAISDGRACVDLTLPAGALTDPADLHLDDVFRIISVVVDPNRKLGGVAVRVRGSADEPYQSLDDLIPASEPEPYVHLVEDAGSPARSGADRSGVQPRSGPVSDAGRQPSGALSGVTVFATAGHGWTAGSSSWFLQRPLLLDMIEDYGNIDQLNYFVHYLFNAGATVVPFRPVGYQDNEIVLDQDDPEVTYAGSWSNSSSSPYYENGRTVSGVHYRFAVAAASETATARYTPDIPAAGFYPVYTWALDGSNRTTQLYRISHSGGVTEVVVDHRMVGRGWVWLGNYWFEPGTGGYVEISNESAEGGNVIADAIRFGNGMGNVVGDGPGTVSGYPRDEEAQRYWAESETAVNAVGMPSSIYNCCSSDQDDNVGTAARWAREMNDTAYNSDRWRRIYIEFHSNASNGSARGTMALVTGNATTYQDEYATILGDEIEQDMQILDSGFEYNWASLSNPYAGSYGAISTSNNSNEFDATILEVAFHDNAQDAALMLDPKVRDAVARSSLQGIVKFLNWQSGGAIPLAFLPTPPRHVRATANGSGGVVIAWDAPLAGEAYGDPATGYRVYRSFNGRGFDSGTDVGNALATVLNDLPANITVYFRVAAYNDGGESLPSAVVAVRRPASGTAACLIVNGFDRVDRSLDPRQTLAGVGTLRRPILGKVNSFDYVIQHAEAMAAASVTFDSCENDSVIDADVPLGNYSAVDWICGEESSADNTFDATEQSLITAYCNAGGNVFVSGAEIAWDLDHLNNGRSFYNNYLKAGYVGDDAGTYTVVTSAGSIFSGIPSLTFDDGALFYDVEYPDVLTPSGGSVTALTYSGGAGGTAGVVFAGPFRIVNFGFPFETITDPARRSDVMGAIMNFFDVGTNGPPVPVEVIVESRDPGGAVTPPPAYTEQGSWISGPVKSTAAGVIGTGSRYTEYSLPNTGTDNATFVPAIAAPGKYDVSVTWGNEADCTNAQFTVRHHNGETAQLQSQRPDALGIISNHNRWISLGEYWLDAGQDANTASVNLSEETITGQPYSGYPPRFYADAVRFSPIRGWPNGDTNGDGRVDIDDYLSLPDCLSGPGGGYAQPSCEDFDFDVDGDVDLADVEAFQHVFTP